MWDIFGGETTLIILTREFLLESFPHYLDTWVFLASFLVLTFPIMPSWFCPDPLREVGYGYVSRPDGEKVTPSWLKEGNYQIESRGRKYEVDLVIKIVSNLTFHKTWLVNWLSLGGVLSAVKKVPFRFP